MWEILEPDAPEYLAALRRLSAKHPESVPELFARLKELLHCLQRGMPLPVALNRGWIHHKYKMGMKSIDSGGGKGRPSLRLYIYPERESEMIVVLWAGEKAAQNKDVNRAYTILDAYLTESEKGE